jgi:HEAT repeat protein
MSEPTKRRKPKKSKGRRGKRKKAADLLGDSEPSGTTTPSGATESGIENSGASGEEADEPSEPSEAALGSAPDSGSESEVKVAASPARGIKELLRALRKGSDKERAKAAKELGSLGSKARKAVPYLAKAVEDDSKTVRYRAARALGHIGPDAVRGVPALLRALGEGSKDRSRDAKSVSGAAARAIKRIGSPALPHLLSALETDALRRRAGRLLRSIAPTNAKEERESLSELLGLESRRAAIAAVDALEQHEAKAVPLLLLSAAEGHDEVGRRAMRALRTIGKPAVSPLAKALNDKMPAVRACAAASLGDLANRVSQKPVSRMIHRLQAAAEDKAPSVRAAALGALSQLTDYEDRVLPTLITAIGDAEASVSLQAVMGVLKVNTDGHELAETMIDVLEGRANTYTRVGACMVLMHLGTDAKAAVDALVDALEDSAPEVREYAHLALNAIRTPSMRLKVIRTASMRLKVAEPDAKKSRVRVKTKKKKKTGKKTGKKAGKKKTGKKKGAVPRRRVRRR